MKNIFKKAHEMTREMVEKYDVDYSTQFGLCVAFFIEEEEQEIETKEDLKDELIKVMEDAGEIQIKEITHFACNPWIKYGKKRVYVELYFRYRGGLMGSFKTYIDYSDEDAVFTQNLSGIGSIVYNDMMKAGYQFVRDNIDKIIEIA